MHTHKNDDDPSYSDELAGLPTWDQGFWLSRAYIEAACLLSANMIKGEFSSQYSSSRVIFHLARQGIELFLKSAIQAADNKLKPLGHNIDSLFIKYRNYYPDLRFYFQMPQHFQIDLNKDLFQESINEFHSTLDQRHRYATDKKGQSFTSSEIFNPLIVCKELDELCRVLKVIEWTCIRPLVAAINKT